jgi:hypothetical protein
MTSCLVLSVPGAGGVRLSYRYKQVISFLDGMPSSEFFPAGNVAMLFLLFAYCVVKRVIAMLMR